MQISKDTIKDKLWATAFDNPNSWFGACNLATAGDDSFAKLWHDKFGGKTWAFYGKSDYSVISKGETLMNKVRRSVNGSFSYIGCQNYPMASLTNYVNGKKANLVEVR